MRAKAIGLSAVLFVGAAVGCRTREVERPRPQPVVIERGYYYDEEYVDVGGVRHPRVVYYYDGRGWDRRDHYEPTVVLHDRSRYGFARPGPHVEDHHGGPRR